MKVEVNKLCAICALCILVLTSCSDNNSQSNSDSESSTSTVTLVYNEKELTHSRTFSDLQQQKTYIADLQTVESEYTEMYHAFEKVDSTQKLREVCSEDMEHLKSHLEESELFSKIDEYEDTANGIQVYGLDQGKAKMYSAAYQLDGQQIITFTQQWSRDALTAEDLDSCTSEASDLTGLKISGADFKSVYNEMISELSGNSYASVTVTMDGVHKYYTIAVQGFDTEDEVWSFYVCNVFSAEEIE